jgi:hypothetical protein
MVIIELSATAVEVKCSCLGSNGNAIVTRVPQTLMIAIRVVCIDFFAFLQNISHPNPNTRCGR